MASLRTSRRSRRRHGPRPASVVLAGVLTTVILGAFIWLAENAYNGLPFLSYRTVYVSLPNIGHLKQHDPVDIAGVRVGQVLTTSTKNNRALVELQLQGVGPLPVDSKVIVRANGLLGARYVELAPGSSHQMLANGATLMETNPTATYTWGLPEALNLFDPKTRTALGQMLNGLGQGVEGRGSQLNEAIHVGAPSGRNFDRAAYAILARPGAAQAFLPNVSSAMTALNASRDNIANLLSPAATTAQGFVDRRSDVDRALVALPQVEQPGFDYGLSNPGLNLVGAVQNLGNAANRVLPFAVPGVRAAATLLKGAAAPLRGTKPVFNEVPRAVSPALSILTALNPDLSPLHGLFTNLVDPVKILSLHGCDIQNFSTGVRSLVSWGTLPGTHYGPNSGFPFSAIVGPQEATPFANTGLTYPNDTPYHQPCNFSPGPNVDNATILQTLSGVFH